VSASQDPGGPAAKASQPLVATWGEALLRLSPPAGQRLRQARRLELHVGGSEANVAVGLATLGVPSRWLSAVSDDELGETVLAAIRAHGVDVGLVARASARTGTYYYDPGNAGRPPSVIYDRAGSAFARMAAGTVAENLLQGCGQLHLSGINLALGAAAARATAQVWELASRLGLRRSFDLNYRSSLGTPAGWVDSCQPFVTSCDLLFIAERDARLLYGAAEVGETESLTTLREHAPGAEIVLTRGARGAASLSPDGRLTLRPAGKIASLGRIGRGDAFAAGYLASQAREPGNAAAALERGVAAASYKSALAGDLAVLDAKSLEELRLGGSDGDVRR